MRRSPSRFSDVAKQDRDERQSNMVDWTGKRRPDKEAVEAGRADVLAGTSSTPADG
jgi:hypothetical protein